MGAKRERRSEKERMYACWFCSVPGIGSRTVEKLSALCPGMEELYRAGEKLWKQALTARQMEQIRMFAKHTDPGELWELLARKEIGFVTLPDQAYPGRLREIPDPPYGLFFKGRLPGADCPSAAVIGARDCSAYGSFVAGGIGRRLGECGVEVISGMARGIDGIGQEEALKAGGRSFGVLGCGVDICYPASNERLYERLCAQGGILSVYPPGTEARAQHFPPRNRIVSGLADVLIVVEARDRSGTLITVDMALEQGKEVYAVPGRVTDRLSDGCNQLIRQGAGVFLSPDDFLREMGEGRWRGMVNGPWGRGCASEETCPAGRGLNCPEDQTQSRPELDRLTREQRELYGVLELQPMSAEQIGERLTRAPGLSKLTALLMGLCMERLAVQVSPGQFALRTEEETE